MSTLTCHSCGANNQPNGGASYIVCQFCRSSISVASFIKESPKNIQAVLVDAGLSDDESKKIARLFDDAEHYVEMNEYDSAKRNFEDILRIYPRHLPSRLYLANCLIYDIKINPLERGLKVKEIIQGASAKNQDISEIFTIKESIAFNLVAMGEKLVNGIDALKLIQISSEIQPVHKERDALAKRFFENLHAKLDARIRQGFKDSGKQYSPTQNDIEIMVVGSSYSVAMANLCATILYHIKNNKDFIHQNLLTVQDRVQKGAVKADNQVSVFTFSFFSSVKEKQLFKSEILG